MSEAKGRQGFAHAKYLTNHQTGWYGASQSNDAVVRLETPRRTANVRMRVVRDQQGEGILHEPCRHAYRIRVRMAT